MAVPLPYLSIRSGVCSATQSVGATTERVYSPNSPSSNDEPARMAVQSSQLELGSRPGLRLGQIGALLTAPEVLPDVLDGPLHPRLILQTIIQIASAVSVEWP